MTEEDTLYYWAKRYVSSCDYDDEHPGDPHGGDELDYCRDAMRRHLEVMP
jgi:hypothetical protein